MTRLHVALSLSLVVCLVAGCLIAPRVTALSLDQDDTDKPGLQFRVSEGTTKPQARETKAPPITTPLSNPRIANILRRLSPLRMDRDDQQPFAFRARSLPPPLTGKTINVAFPATENIPAPETSVGPLQVLRYSPEGDVPLAPNLSVTFSQPMIAVSSQEEAAANVPVRLSPELPGKWRWIGTNTLLFEPHVRFAMATRYSVTVPAGTRSHNGGQTASDVTWTFTTPPPTIKQKYPENNSQSIERDTLMFIEFDQRVEPTAVLRNIKVQAEGTEISTRLATKEEVEADSTLKDRIQNAEKDRWLAFRAVDQTGATKLALPSDKNITVSVGSGTPSLEGPL
ncbi:MAG TPA: Ig-like domain-containing protein, partial [Pyrinomonadaceae bacterium]